MVPIWKEKYKDTGELRPQDEIDIEDFVDAADRTSMDGSSGTPFFSGRETEINKFRKSVSGFAKGVQSNRTLVFEGPPGCGKSALLEQLRMETGTYPEIGGRRWIAPVITGSSAMTPASIMRKVDNAISKQLAKEALSGDVKPNKPLSQLADLLGVSMSDLTRAKIKMIADRGFRAFGTGIGAKLNVLPDDIETLADMRSEAWKDWNIVLMIDEAQEISKEVKGSHPSTLNSIHQGISDLPIMFCAFGLHGTADALGNVGVSRTSIGRVFRMSSLNNTHSRFVTERAFEQFGIRNGDHWKAEILNRSKQWPQHLSCYLTETLRAVQSDIERHGELDAHNLSLEKALEEGDKLRARYYVSRVNSFDKTREYARSHMKAVSRLIQGSSVEKPIDVDHLTALVGKECNMDEIRALGLIKACAACGLIAFGDIEDVCYPAIPSFVTHLIGESQSHEISEKSSQTHQLER